MIRIMTDSAADLDAKTAKDLGIAVLPFMIRLGEETVLADVNLKPEEYYEILRNSQEAPSTCQMSPLDIENLYRELGKDGDSILYITISSKASGVYNTACLVAEQLNAEGFDITVYDSTMFSYIIGNGAIMAAQMAKEGKTKEEIIAALDEIFKRDTAYFMVDDLSFLKRGGRIKATTMVVGSLLDIKPILNVNDGLVEAYKKVKGTKRAIATLVNYAVERMDNPEENEVFLLHTDAEDKIEILQKMVEEKLNPAKISIHKVGPIITSHAGLGVVGIYFKHKEPYESYTNE